jgi:iron complex outermembrane recepter protein
MRFLPLCVLLAGVVTRGAGQIPAQADSTHRDSVHVLPEITVTVARSTETVTRVPAAIGVADRADIQRGQATLGLDESLNNIPGVYVANRYNYNLDQRVVIRGFGTRSNFGIRGIKVLLDGVPQTLPDGQSQLTNVDYGNLSRIEVLRGASSSLYGNASGGVLSLTSEPAAAGPFLQSVRAEGGSFGLFRIGERTTARRGAASATLAVSRTSLDGYRQHSGTEFTQLSLGANYLLGGATNLGLRLGYADAPKADNPGALTTREVLAKPESASANNILRHAGKDLSQGQLGLTMRHLTGRGEVSIAVFGVLRDLKNALSAPPPDNSAPNTPFGQYTTIDRQVYGLRLGTDQRLGDAPTAPRIVTGVDLQYMRDDRESFRAVAGVPDTTILNQLEKVAEVGPYVQVHWSPLAELVLSGGGRYDAVRFDVADRHLTDGVDNSGDRTMSALSGNLGASWVGDVRLRPYVTVSTSFETPTTTELANQPNSTGGFNRSLDPQRAVNYEVGVRGTVGPISYSAAGFLGRVRDAIIQYSEVSGRGYYTNAGRVKNDGLELGVNGRVSDRLRLFANYTWANYRYDRYRIVSGASVDTLDGKRVPGVPKAFIRLGVRAGPIHGAALDLDHTMASSIFADDRNSLSLNGWGAGGTGVINGVGLGVTSLRLSWQGRSGGAWLSPFVGVNNLWDRTYISALTINGINGRVFEPAPGRTWYLGAEIGWAGAGRSEE